ncbi:MAG: oligoendopeptidase F, partial [Caldilineaceae bacterium]|nr:oligoendopeptidase F [Caldilineaceae bacterium]
MSTPLTKEYKLSGWDLSELLAEPTDAVIQTQLAEINAAVSAFMDRRAQLQPDMDPEVFLETVEQYETLTELLYNPVAYASLWFSSDTQSTD